MLKFKKHDTEKSESKKESRKEESKKDRSRSRSHSRSRSPRNRRDRSPPRRHERRYSRSPPSSRNSSSRRSRSPPRHRRDRSPDYDRHRSSRYRSRSRSPTRSSATSSTTKSSEQKGVKKVLKKQPTYSLIELEVNDRLGKKVRVKCAPNDLVGDFKKLVAAQIGTEPSKIVLKKWYKEFKDHITLADYELHDGMNLELYYR
ncbi:unnamed protein product [Mucor circinelloides]|uniref:Ubiquitin-like modifier HUB1 n=1 Tax=Mucor circinelloides f. circinelloides (strain 1006PhL) TaxID=1220926 RepID=S2K8Q0_MUCC1|nr:hypothetical protein HMPREF1544_01296 [Mucor circinelloides 1006PhL]KAG1096175.1 hypothetical protein G6F42_018411 [Rhizopus arrhizus]